MAGLDRELGQDPAPGGPPRARRDLVLRSQGPVVRETREEVVVLNALGDPRGFRTVSVWRRVADDLFQLAGEYQFKERDVPEPLPTPPSRPHPRPYQAKVVDDLPGLLRDCARRAALVEAPTGAGKTVIASLIIERAVGKGSHVLFVAPRRELVRQCSEKLTALAVPHGIVMAGVEPLPGVPVQVASKDTLTHRDLPRCDLLIIDEAHHAVADSYLRLLEELRRRNPRLVVVGLTATPARPDGRGLRAAFDILVPTISDAGLVRGGWLVPVQGWAYDVPDWRSVRVVAGDYDMEQAGEIAIRLAGNVVDAWLAQCGPRRTVVFACNIAHSREMVARFEAEGIRAEHLDGNTPTEERARILQRLHTGETLVVSNVNVLTEGWDEPLVECVVLARPTKSIVLYKQMVGRGRRPAPGKKELRLHDHAGAVAEHGLPGADRAWTLEEGHIGVKRADPGLPPLRTCDSCLAIFDGALDTCPRCQHHMPARGGRVVEVSARAVRLGDVEVKRPLVVDPVSAKNAYFGMLEGLRRKGKKLQVAAFIYKGKFGSLPPYEWRLEFERNLKLDKQEALL